MTEERLEAILQRQMPDAEKRRRAHFVIDTSRCHAAARRQVDDIIRALAGRPSRQLPAMTPEAGQPKKRAEEKREYRDFSRVADSLRA